MSVPPRPYQNSITPPECMTQSERIRHLQEQATRYVHRSKCVDASLQTLIVQSQASSVAAPKKVTAVVDRADCPTNAVIAGKGANGEYLGILQAAQHCAICPGLSSDIGSPPNIELPVPCVDNERVPFAQRNIDAGSPAPYVPPCTDPGKRDYPRTPLIRGRGCNYQHLPVDSA